MTTLKNKDEKSMPDTPTFSLSKEIGRYIDQIEFSIRQRVSYDDSNGIGLILVGTQILTALFTLTMGINGWAGFMCFGGFLFGLATMGLIWIFCDRKFGYDDVNQQKAEFDFATTSMKESGKALMTTGANSVLKHLPKPEEHLMLLKILTDLMLTADPEWTFDRPKGHRAQVGDLYTGCFAWLKDSHTESWYIVRITAAENKTDGSMETLIRYKEVDIKTGQALTDETSDLYWRTNAPIWIINSNEVGKEAFLNLIPVK